MFSRRAIPALTSCRYYSTSAPGKPSIKLVAELRKLTDVSITKAREALAATNNDVQAAFRWLDTDLVASGAKKAAKLGDRTTQQGLVGVSTISNSDDRGRGVRTAMVEVNCETDFVGRNPKFDALVADIAHTAAFLAEAQDSTSFFNAFPVEQLLEAPVISRESPGSEADKTVGSAINDSIARFGERIQLRRAVSVVHTPPKSDVRVRVASYFHGSVNLPTNGHIGTLAVLGVRHPNVEKIFASPDFVKSLEGLERALARQIVGFPTARIRSATDAADEEALYDQQFMMYASANGENVSSVLQQWLRVNGHVETGEANSGLEVLEFLKWTVGEEST
ncbi:hypothetical protein BDW22DRAFT_72107 [Trametopsis cervina]|nr:hypothetical protein BDW22DRAFT_72107 [Trametopsis cervina]